MLSPHLSLEAGAGHGILANAFDKRPAAAPVIRRIQIDECFGSGRDRSPAKPVSSSPAMEWPTRITLDSPSESKTMRRSLTNMAASLSGGWRDSSPHTVRLVHRTRPVLEVLSGCGGRTLVLLQGCTTARTCSTIMH